MSAYDDSTVEPWWVYRGTGIPIHSLDLPPAPPWRSFTAETKEQRGQLFKISRREIEVVNAAIYLRRPLLVTGKPGTGKTTLAYAVAYELGLGPVLAWPITSRSTLQDGLYRYDAVGRLQDEALRSRRHRSTKKSSVTGTEPAESSNSSTPDIGNYIRLGPLGTAMLPTAKPRCLLIDELDKSDIDLPNDLLHIFEEGEFIIPELARLPEDQGGMNVWTFDERKRVSIQQGRVHCDEFPFVVITSNGERDFPPAFMRRCLRLDIQQPSEDELYEIVASRLTVFRDNPTVKELILRFVKQREQKKNLSTDQLLQAIFLAGQLTLHDSDLLDARLQDLLDALLRSLSDPPVL